MQLIDCSHSASYSQRAFPFSSSVSVDHESTNDATELCTFLISMICLTILSFSLKFVSECFAFF